MAHANTVYFSSTHLDHYQDMYDEVAKLNGDFEPFPKIIETFHGQLLYVREQHGRLKDLFRLINTGKDQKKYHLKDDYSQYSYLNYIAAKCWLDICIERSPASIDHLSIGLKTLDEIVLSDKALIHEHTFNKEISTQLSTLIIKHIDKQNIWMALRMFANYAIENAYWGFDETLTFKLDEITIPSLNKKTRVSILDHESGPFTRSEIADIAQAIHRDNVSIQERIIVKLAMQYGLRPIQLALLREKDIFQDTKLDTCYINIPRVKGRVAQQRRNTNNFMLRELPKELFEDISRLITSESRATQLQANGNLLPRPLFKRKIPSEHYLAHPKLVEYAWHMDSSVIGRYFAELERKLHITSKHVFNEEGQPTQLRMNCYRFRYTLGTRMVMDGKTPDEVAIALDHSTTASVNHYFRYNRDLIDFIDDTFETSATLTNAVARWQGFLIDESDGSIGGSLVRISDIASLGKCLKNSHCDMHPTVSCYSCAKFRPFKDANHGAQLKVIEAERDFIISNSTGPAKYQLNDALQGALEIVEAQRFMRENNDD